MRWDRLFDELESRLELELREDDEHLAREEERLRIARLTLRERMLAIRDSADRTPATLSLVLADSAELRMTPGTIGRDWIGGLAVGGSPLARALALPFHAIGSIRLQPDHVSGSLAEPSGRPRPSLDSRLGLAFVLRDLCRRRVTVVLRTRGHEVSGTIDRVGRDHLDLAEHDVDRHRRSSAVRGIHMVPFSQLVLVSW